MTESLFSSTTGKPPLIQENQYRQSSPSVFYVDSAAQGQISKLAQHLALATFVLMAIGSATRVMNAGLACPDWPLCYGQLIPQNQMNLQVFLEWFHRLDASLVGFGTIVLAGLGWWKRQELPRWTPWMCSLSLFLVVFQGILGGLTVTQLLRFDIVTAHLGTALLFFSTLLTLSLLLRPYSPLATAHPLKPISFVALLLVYAQSLLGGVVASRWALHQCLGGSELCAVMNSHVIGVFPATIACLGLVIWAKRIPSLSIVLRRLSVGIVAALLTQIALGILAYKLHLQIEPLTVAHQSVGAILLGLLVAFTLFVCRDEDPLLHSGVNRSSIN